jgi:hypothetical protein
MPTIREYSTPADTDQWLFKKSTSYYADKCIAFG